MFVSYFSLYCVNLRLPLPGGMHSPVLIWFIDTRLPFRKVQWNLKDVINAHTAIIVAEYMKGMGERSFLFVCNTNSFAQKIAFVM